MHLAGWRISNATDIMWECPVQISAWSLPVVAELFMFFLIPFMQMPECDLGYVTVTFKSFPFQSAISLPYDDIPSLRCQHHYKTNCKKVT